MKDYFQLLGLQPHCTIEDIKQAYRRLAKKYHPDINKSPDANQKFIEISEAYEVLLHKATCSPVTEQQAQYDYETFIREVREAAQKQARMRYEKFAREHEAFRESGLYDITLLLKYLGRVVVPLLAIGLISIPISVSFSEHSIGPMFYLFFCWTIGGFLLFDAFLKRKEYFKLGKFYYSFDKILQFYKTHNDSATNDCFYCKGLKANSYPYKINFIKIKDVYLKNLGPLQHYAGYDRKEFSVSIPRSQKAFIVHSVTTITKLLSITGAFIFLPYDSYIWRFTIGAVIGWALTSIVLMVTQTKSKTAYLFSYGMIIKIAIWSAILASVTNFDFKTNHITSSEYIKFILVIMVFCDAFLEQLLKAPKNWKLFKPISKQYQNMSVYFTSNYQLYLEIPLWTTIYPIVRWIF